MSEMEKNEILDTMELFRTNGEKIIPMPRDVPEPIYKNLVEIMMSNGILVTVDKSWVLFEGEKYNLFLFAVAVNFMRRHCKRFRDREMNTRKKKIVVCGNGSGYNFKIVVNGMTSELSFTHIEAALFYLIGVVPGSKPSKYRVDDALLDVLGCLINGAKSTTYLDGHNDDDSFIPFMDMVREYGVRAYKYGLIFMKIVPRCYDMNIGELESFSKARPHWINK